MIDRTRRDLVSHIATRWIIGLAAIIMALFGHWQWAWMTLAVGAMHVVSDAIIALACLQATAIAVMTDGDLDD